MPKPDMKDRIRRFWSAVGAVAAVYSIGLSATWAIQFHLFTRHSRVLWGTASEKFWTLLAWLICDFGLGDALAVAPLGWGRPIAAITYGRHMVSRLPETVRAEWVKEWHLMTQMPLLVAGVLAVIAFAIYAYKKFIKGD